MSVKLADLVVAGEVGGDAGSVRLHGLLAGLPSGRADLSVLVRELEGLDQPQRLVDVATDGEVVDGDLKLDGKRLRQRTLLPGAPLELDGSKVVEVT